MTKRLVLLILSMVFLLFPLAADDRGVYFPGPFTLSIAGSVEPLFSFEPSYDLLPQLFLGGEFGLHFGTLWGGSVLLTAGLVLPSIYAISAYRYSGFEEYGLGIGLFHRQFVSSTLYFEYLCKLFANVAWQPETLTMYFGTSFIPEFTITPAITSWRFGALQGSFSLPIKIQKNFYSFGFGFSVRFQLAPWSGAW